MDSVRLLILDDGEGRFGPMGDLRATFDFRSGAFTGRERIERIVGRPADAVRLPASLAGLYANDACRSVNPEQPTAGEWLIINGRCIDCDVLQRAAGLMPGYALKQEDGQLVAARVMFSHGSTSWALPTDTRAILLNGRVLIERPWQLLAALNISLAADLSMFDLPKHKAGANQVVQFGDHPVKVHPSAELQPACVLNAQNGSIVIEADCVVSPTAVIEGPCYLGQGTRIGPGAYLRGPIAAGPRCRLGGEVSHTIIQGYANKAHQGHLGHSLIGQWVNLGADTNVSNLKNTYGQVRVQLTPDGEKENTELTFFGGVFGDFVRTAVGTRVATGSVVGTGSMLAMSDFSPGCVPAMRFITDKSDSPYDAEKFLSTAQTMMSRRDQRMSSELEQYLRSLCAQAANDVKRSSASYRLAR